MKKLTLTEVKVAEAPQPQYSFGLIDAIKEVEKNIHAVAVENGAEVITKLMSFELTKGAYEYLRENRDKVLEGLNKYGIDYGIAELRYMYTEKVDGEYYLRMEFK